MKERSWAGILVGLFLVVILGVVPAIMVGVGMKYRSEDTVINEVPRVEIDLNSATLAEINEADKNVAFTDTDVRMRDNGEISSYAGVELSGRGNSTSMVAKKPYNLKFDKRVNLAGDVRAKSWVLLANAYDGTYLRNDVALHLAGMLGDEYAAKGEFVELYINKEYVGLYYLAPKTTISKGSVDLKQPLGVLVELDNLYGWLSACYYTYMGNCLVLKDAVSKDHATEAMEQFLIDFDKLEIAAEAGDYATVEKLIDVESFAKYYLVSEFTSNPDAYSTSWFMYKDGEGDKIHAGPAWDFDLALANRNWGGSGRFLPEDSRTREKEVFGVGYYDENGEYIETPQDALISKVMYYLVRIPEFREVVGEVFDTKMSGRAEELVEWIRQRSAYTEVAAKKDATRWGVSGRDADIEKLIDWIQRRYAFFEREYGRAGESRAEF